MQKMAVTNSKPTAQRKHINHTCATRQRLDQAKLLIPQLPVHEHQNRPAAARMPKQSKH